jgi:hypothetical protein
VTSRATAIRLLALVGGRGLLSKSHVEHFLREDFADFEEDVLNVGELGPPGRALGTVELLDQVFGNPLDVEA